MKNFTENMNDNRFRYHLSLKTTERNLPDQGHFVYLVDDDIDDLVMSSRALSKSNRVNEVCIVGTADRLFQQMKDHGHFNDLHHSPNKPVIVMDVHMPSIDGIEMLEQLKDHPMTADLPVILLTTDISGSKVHDAYRLQADGFMSKPFDLDKFHDVIDHIEAGQQSLKADGFRVS